MVSRRNGQFIFHMKLIDKGGTAHWQKTANIILLFLFQWLFVGSDGRSRPTGQFATNTGPNPEFGKLVQCQTDCHIIYLYCIVPYQYPSRMSDEPGPGSEVRGVILIYVGGEVYEPKVHLVLSSSVLPSSVTINLPNNDGCI